MPLFANEESAFGLNLICGVGEFGSGIVEMVGDHLSLLERPLQLGTRLCSVKSPKDLPQKIKEARVSLTSLANLNDIERLSPGISRNTVTKVRQIFVGSLGDLTGALEGISQTINDNLSDDFEALGFSSDFGSTGEQSALRDLFAIISPLRLCSLKNLTNASLDEPSVRSSMAGALLMRLFLDTGDGGRRTIWALGFSGMYGVVGDSLNRLASEFGFQLLERNLQALPQSETELPLPSGFSSLLESYSSLALGLNLFSRSQIGKQSNSEEMRAKAKWDGRTLRIELDKGLVGLQVTRKGQESMWVEEIRRYSRTLDMTVAYQWRMRIENSARTLIKEIRETLPVTFRRLVQTTARGPAIAERVIELLEQDMQSPRLAETEILDRVEESLTALDNELKSRPNMLMLAARMLVWLVPALLIGPVIIGTFYVDSRAFLFSLLYVVCGLLGPAGWLLWVYEKSRRRVDAARKNAIAAILERQQAILSENTVGYLNDLIVAELSSLLRVECSRILESCRNAYRDLRTKLSESNEKDLRSSLTFAPVLTRPMEYKKAFDLLGVSVADELERAAGDGVLAFEDQGESKLSGQVVTWCSDSIARKRKEGQLPFGELWRIRLSSSHEENELAAVQRMWRLALPLLQQRFSPTEAQLVNHVLVPQNLLTPQNWELLGVPKQAVRETGKLEILCFSRTGLSQPLIDRARHE